MTKLRLDERLLYTTAPRLTAGQSADTLLRKSIMSHLTRLLNTRKGSVPIDMDIGLSDMSNIAGSFAQGTTQKICEEVVDQIEHYEPRLRQPKVSMADVNTEREVITLRFEVIGFLADNNGKPTSEMLSMVMRINAHGYIKLEAG